MSALWAAGDPSPGRPSVGGLVLAQLAQLPSRAAAPSAGLPAPPPAGAAGGSAAAMNK